MWEDKRTPHQRLLDEKHRKAVGSLGRAASDAASAAFLAHELGAEDLTLRIREVAARLGHLRDEFDAIEPVAVVSEKEPFEAPIDNFNGRCSIGDLHLESGIAVDLKLPGGDYIRTTSDVETYAGSVSKSTMHLNFPLLAKAKSGLIEVRLPVPHGVMARWLRELTNEERAGRRRPLLTGEPATPPAHAHPLVLDHQKRFYEKDLVDGAALKEGEPIEVFLADGRAVAGTWDSDRSSYGRRVRVGLLKFQLAAAREDYGEVYLPLVEEGILVRRAKGSKGAF